MFQDHHIKYFITAMLGFLLICVGLALSDAAGWILPLALLWLVICLAGSSFFHVRRVNRYLAMLNDCRVQDFLQAYLDHPPVNFMRNTVDWYNLNLVAGYMELGDYETAEELLKTIVPNNSRLMQAVLNRITWLFSIQLLQLKQGKIDASEVTLENIHHILQSNTLNAANSAIYSKLYTNRRFLLQAEKGDDSGVIEHWESELLVVQTKRSRVAVSCQLAEAYIRCGQKEKAAPLLHFAIENGGDTGYVKKAKQALEMIK